MKTDGRKHNDAAHLKKLPQQKKKPITIYEAGEDIEAIGGIKTARKYIKDFYAALIEAKKKGQKLNVRFI